MDLDGHCCRYLSSRVQLVTDGLKVYLKAVGQAIGNDIDYAMLVKVYGLAEGVEKRYSPAVCLTCESRTITGDPNPNHSNTSYVDRQNLSMRMGMRRFNRLTNAFSKKIENHAAIVLYFMYYNFARIRQTLRCSPAVAAGVDSRLREIKDIVAMIEACEGSSN
jgi:hypothetical protein